MIENVAVPPIAYWRTNPAAAHGTEINPARNAATDIDDFFLKKFLNHDKNRVPNPDSN